MKSQCKLYKGPGMQLFYKLCLEAKLSNYHFEENKRILLIHYCQNESGRRL